MVARHDSVLVNTSAPIHRQIVLLAIVLCAALTPVLPGTSMKVDSTLSAGMVLALGAYLMLRAAVPVGHTALDVPIVAFLLVCSLATLTSSHPFLSYFPSVSRGDGLLVYLAYGAIALMAARLAREEVPALLFSLLIAGVVISAVAILQYYGFDATHVFRDKVLPFDRSWGTLANPIFLGGYVSLMLPLALTLTLHAPEPRWHWYGAATCGMYGALVASETRAAWLACAVAVVLLVRFLPDARPRRRRWVVLAGVCAAITAVMALTHTEAHLAQRALSIVDPQHVSLQGRLFVWKNVLPLIAHRPILGWGFSALGAQHPGATSPAYFRLFGANVVDAEHNELLHIAFATGLVGLAAYLWVWGRVFRSLWPPIRTGSADGQLHLGVAASMVAYFIWLQTGWSMVGPANAFWALAGAAVALSHSRVPPSDELQRVRHTALAEPIVAAAACAALVLAVLPDYRAARQVVADEERVQDAESWVILHETAHAEMRGIAGRWRALAWSCFQRTADTGRCADNNALRFRETSVNWQVTHPTYVTTPTSITMIVNGAVGSPLVADERCTATIRTLDGTARDECGAK